ncbi:MAG TPA: UvrD-helicase domain-containing protein, partial [Myxococcota bacterium]|nr:UvrD-helicase domain-containing protein [Myxococcota bacterium]
IKRLLRALPNASIGTFHAFASDVLRKETKSLGLNESFGLLLPHEEKKLAHNIMRPLIIDGIKDQSSILRGLVARFRLGSNPLSLGLIDALLEYYGKLFEQGHSITGLNQAQNHVAFDLSSDLDAIRQACIDFHAPNENVKKRLDQVLEQCSVLNISSESKFAREYSRLKHVVKGNFGDISSRRTLVYAINTLGVHAVDHFVKEDEEVLLSLLSSFHHEFEEAKSTTNKLTYSDLLDKMCQALRCDQALRHRLKSRYLHILVDEYQDTSPVQESIIAYLCENKAKAELLKSEDRPLQVLDFNNGASLFVVGDKKQSIYGFRGANIALFDSMIEKMADTHGSNGAFNKRLLTINRRSASSLIELINLASRFALKQQGYEPQEDLEVFENNKGTAELWVSADDKDQTKTNANLWCSAYGVAQLLASDQEIRAKDIVILVRRMRSATALKAMLGKLGIAARVIGGEGFFQEQEVVDLLSALKLINDPHHPLASSIVFRSPMLLFSDQDVLAVHNATAGKGLSLINACCAQTQGMLSHSSSQRLTAFMDLLALLRTEIAGEGLSGAIDRIVATFDLPFWYGLMDDGEQALANINKLRSLLSSTRQNPFASIEEHFLAIFNNHHEAQALNTTDDDFVTVMTIHQSKGLEFNTVVLADGESALPTLSADILAHKTKGLSLRPKGRPIQMAVPKSEENAPTTKFQQAAETMRHMEQAEIARLLYVALTRAKSRLYIACSEASFRGKDG